MIWPPLGALEWNPQGKRDLYGPYTHGGTRCLRSANREYIIE